MYLPSFGSGVSAKLAVLLALTASVRCQELVNGEDCGAAQPAVTARIYSVLFNNFFSSNTTINLGGQSIEINNAPTSLSTLATFTDFFTSNVTTTTTTTATTTPGAGSVAAAAAAASTTLSVVPVNLADIGGIPDTGAAAASATAGAAGIDNALYSNSFLIFVSVTPTLEARNLERNIKRESNYGYMLANGSIVTDCGLGAIFTINDGKLTNEFGVLSTSPGISYAQFESSPVPASITTTFSLVGPLLQWSNPIFDGGFAKYCATPERTVDMIFSGPFPTDCVEVYLLVIGLLECPTAASSVAAASSSYGSAGANENIAAHTSSPASSSAAAAASSSAAAAATSSPAAASSSSFGSAGVNENVVSHTSDTTTSSTTAAATSSYGGVSINENVVSQTSASITSPTTAAATSSYGDVSINENIVSQSSSSSHRWMNSSSTSLTLSPTTLSLSTSLTAAATSSYGGVSINENIVSHSSTTQSSSTLPSTSVSTISRSFSDTSAAAASSSYGSVSINENVVSKSSTTSTATSSSTSISTKSKSLSDTSAAAASSTYGSVSINGNFDSKSSTTTSTSTSSSTSTSTTSSINLVAQAESIIIASSLQPFCSSLLGFTIPTATSTLTVTQVETFQTSVPGLTSYIQQTPTLTIRTTIPSSTYTAVHIVTTSSLILTAVTVTNAYPVKRAIKSPVSCDCADDHLEHLTKRTFSTTPIALVVTLSTPTPLATFADDILSTACSAEVQPATTTALAIVTTFPFRSTLETISASLSLKTSTHSTKTKIRTITSGIATIASTTTTTIGYLSTTTITIQATAPTGLVTYLQILPAINNPDSYALSDPATHMTDNDFLTGSREVFIVTNTSQLYSVTHDAYYYRGDGSNGGKLYWSSNPADGEHIFFQRPDLAVGYNQLFLNYTTNTPAVFCLMEASSGDGNSATGLHVRFYPTAADYIAQCDAVKLYLQPV